MAFNWREHLAIHPAAELFPLMSEAELKELAEDIKANGQVEQIVFWMEGGRTSLLDGRNRLDAMVLANLLGIDAAGDFINTKTGNQIRWKAFISGDPYAIAASLNVHRRHLTAEQKRDLIAKLLKATPEKSNRQIADQVKVSHPTVAKVREQLEEKGDVEKVTTSIDTRGRKQPATKQKRKVTKSEPAQSESPETSAERMNAAYAAADGSDEYERDRKEFVALHQKVIEAGGEQAETARRRWSNMRASEYLELTPEEQLEHYRTGLVVLAEQAADLAEMFSAAMKASPSAISDEAIRGVYRVVDRWSALLKATAAARGAP